MTPIRAAIVALLFATAGQAQTVQPLLERPITLPVGAVDLTLHGTYANFATESSNPSTVSGETLALGLDYGATDVLQLGLATAFPIEPGLGFGSVVGNAMAAVTRDVAVRVDLGYERIGINGASNNSLLASHVNVFFGGIGVHGRVPMGPGVAFVFGRGGAAQFGQFTNVGDSGVGFYGGASTIAADSADFVSVGSGDNGSGTVFAIHLPAGLLLQPVPFLAVTVESGYAAAIATSGSSGGAISTSSTVTTHFIPLAIEAVTTPAPSLDIGARFVFDGFVGQSGVSGSGPGWLDQRALMIWLRVHG